MYNTHNMRHTQNRPWPETLIMIATWTKLELEPSALQGTRASSIQVVSSPLLW